ncbi:MAG: glycosyltransferase family 39 protein [Anaerolineales bacterium]|nr:glycosyltransferase family 39 protein [Anaerolineales bacterium]MCB8990965.1 glycosyltransferase family 39 protein [Ardenticatenaceae bacterium]
MDEREAMRPRTRLLLALIVAVYLALGVAFSVIVPLGESPDEVDHFLYARFVAENGRFPVMFPNAADNETMEANQPPLYYLAGAWLVRMTGSAAAMPWQENECYTFDPMDNGRAHFYLHTPAEAFPYQGDALAFHLVRLLSVLIGAVTVLLTFFLGRHIIGSEVGGLVAAGILAFNPQFVFINASVNNDVLTACLGAAIVLASIALAQRPTIGRSLLAGLLVGLGLLTKFALLALWPLTLLGVFVPLLRPPSRPARPALRVLRHTILLLIVPILVSAWWYVRNWRLYGDALAWEVHLQAKGEQVLRTSPLGLHDLLAFARIHFQSYWGWFGWLKIQLPGWAYGLLLALVLISLLGLAWQLGRLLRLFIRRRGGHLLAVGTAPALLLGLLAALSIYASLLRYILTINWSGYQGRLAYAAAAPVAALLAAGWLAVVEGVKRPFLSPLFPLIGLALTLGSLLGLLAPAYARPALYQPPPEASRACLRLGDALLLEAYDVPPRVQPGEPLPVTLYGYGRSAADHARLRLELVGGERVVVGAAEVDWHWSAGEVFSQTVLLPVATDVQPARAVLRVGLLDGTGGWQAAATVEGTAVAAPSGLTTVKLAPSEPFTPTPEKQLNALFDEQLALIGYDVTGQGVTLYWQALAEMPHDYTTFVHVLDEAGEMVAQSDSQPTDGVYPTSIWDVGEVVADGKLVNLGGETAVTLAIGVYDATTLLRLPVTVAGQPQPDDLLRLPLNNTRSD